MSQCRAFTPSELVSLVERYRWKPHEQHGSHAQFTHPVLKGKITIGQHSGKTMPIETVRSVFHNAGMDHFFKMFKTGVSFKEVERAIKAEAKQLFDAPQAQATALPNSSPRPGVN